MAADLPSDDETLGRELSSLVRELYPICRCITGNGVRKKLEILTRYAQITVREWPTGTPVPDGVDPGEWNIKDAWPKDERVVRVADFRASNLHVVSYSV